MGVQTVSWILIPIVQERSPGAKSDISTKAVCLVFTGLVLTKIIEADKARQ